MDHVTRKCKKCGLTKPLRVFPPYIGKDPEKTYRRHACDACHNARIAAWHQAHKEDRLRKVRENYAKTKWSPRRRMLVRLAARRRNAQLRSRVFDHYGGECVACGETEPLFLTLDHIDNDGKYWRTIHSPASANFYKWLIAQGFPGIVQVLCMNCNWGKARNGGILVRDRRLTGRSND